MLKTPGEHTPNGDGLRPKAQGAPAPRPSMQAGCCLAHAPNHSHERAGDFGSAYPAAQIQFSRTPFFVRPATAFYGGVRNAFQSSSA